MPQLLPIERFVDDKGSVTVLNDLEKLLPFSVKRIFFIHTLTDTVRGGHRHIKTRQAIICVQGHCTISTNNGQTKEDFNLENSERCLIIDINDWHAMHSFTPNTILLVLASEAFDPDDYIREPYKEIVDDTL